MNFHKSCYTSRSAGYKYRTLSTNTGERKRRHSKEESTFDRKFKDLKNEISSRILNEVIKSQDARRSIQERFDKVDAKINSMVDVQNSIIEMRKNLQLVENQLMEITEKVDLMEKQVGISENCSLQSRKSSYSKTRPIFNTIVESSTLTN